jgi:hypothetical protein
VLPPVSSILGAYMWCAYTSDAKEGLEFKNIKVLKSKLHVRGLITKKD